MDEERTHPDVGALLRVLREQAGQQTGDVDIHRAEFIQRVKAQVEAELDDPRTRPNLTAIVRGLRQQIGHMTDQVRFHDVGTVQHIGSGVATLSGLPSASTDELVTFPTGVQGLILNLDHARLDVILLGPDAGIQGGDLVTATGQRVQIPVGHQILGRVVNPLGVPLDDRNPVQATDAHFLEQEAPDIIERAPVNEPLHTGVKVVDALFPIGRGQRELILGDRQVGKTTLAVDAILNQRNSDIPCVYVTIGQKKSTVLSVIETLRHRGALAYTTVVIASPEDPPALRYLAPYAGCTIAEFFMHEGRDVLIVYDDLSKHADAYRELSLLLRRPPGREAYPGDIFYLHARLLERACKLHPDRGGGSLTALPIVETKRGNLSAYIPTNLISITDGQIVFDTALFNQGIKPAIDVGLSVSRVGGKAQTEAMRAVTSELKLELSQYAEVSRFARFGTEVDQATRRQIQRGKRLQTVLTQPAHQPLSLAAQVVILWAASENILDDVPIDEVGDFERGWQNQIRTRHPELIQQIQEEGRLPPPIRQALRDAVTEYRQEWLKERNEA